MKTFVSILLVILGLNSIAQTNYFISSSDGDNFTNDGLSALAPWENFSNLNGTPLNAGDTVFIKCGDVIEDSLRLTGTGMPGNPIVITSYGTGPKPIISGSRKLTGWTAGTIRTIISADTIRCLVVNNLQQEYARFPDTGYLTADNSTTVNGFTDAALSSLPDYTGASICVHTSLWTWESALVSNQTSTSITFAQPMAQPTTAPDYNGYGYFFFNRPDLITLPGEWSWSAGTTHYYPPAGIDPDIDDVQGIVLNTGIRIPGNTDYVTISNIEFRNFYEAGIKINHGNSSGILIENCHFSKVMQYGVFMRGINQIISNNTFEDITGRAIYATNCSDPQISYNEFNRIGMIRNYGTLHDDNFTAICIQSTTQGHVHHNTIDSTGYSAIRYDASDGLVERNKISNYMMLLSDGGAVKSFGSFSVNMLYQNNLISNGVFNHDGTPGSNEHIQSAALYFDFHVENSIFRNNVVYDNFETGIFINGGADHCIAENNIIYGGSHQILLNDRFNYPDSMYNDTIRYNKCFALADTVISIRLNSNNNYTIGTIDENYYFNPYGNDNIGKLHGDIGGTTGIEYSFSAWQSVLGFDANSKESFVNWTAAENHSEIFVNDTDSPMTFTLDLNTLYLDLDSNQICDEITVDPYYAEILIKTSDLCYFGLTENDQINTILYPNPANENVYIKASQKITSVEIYSITGELIYSENLLNQNIISINLNKFDSGTYFVQIYSGDEMQTKLLIKQ
jgi:hypothetical protein